MSEDSQITRHCKDCMGIDRCVEAFGDYWPIKSRSGFGCCSPLSPDNKRLPTASKRKRPAVVEELPKEERKAPPKETYVQVDLPTATLPPLSDDDY